MKKSNAEYLMLREEILHLDTVINNTINFFYIFIATYITFALTQDDTIFLLISYIVIIPAYLIVICKGKGMCKIGAYLKVFHEGKEFNWETRRIEFHKNIMPDIFTYMISTTFPFVFVGIAVELLLIYYTPWSYSMTPYEIGKVILWIFLSVFLYVLIYKNRKINTVNYVKRWEELKKKES